MRTLRIAGLAVFVALAVALSALESLVPSPLPWVRLGLANMLTLLAILSWGWREGYTVTLFRILVSALLFGSFMGPSFLLSIGGGLAATTVMALMAPGTWRIFSPIAVSVAGAFVHGLTQVLILRTVLVRTDEVFYLLPWVLLPAVLSGVLTGAAASYILLNRGHALEMLGGRRAPAVGEG